MKSVKTLFCLAVVAMLFVTGCDKEEGMNFSKYVHYFEPSSDIQSKLQEALITMEDGDTIWFSEGTFVFTSKLSVTGKDNIVIMGAGRDKTILDFSGQTSGAEGVLVTDVNWFLIRDLTIQDSDGDALKIKDADGVSMINVGAVWSGEPDEDNGSYGLYPVTSSNVLIDSCYVKGASDAGIYVGQTTKAIVRNSLAEMNVAGIEIENTVEADVYGNTATGNTGGILVFDLPNLTMYGERTRVFNNTVEQNDHRNFAPSGNIVGNVPVGTGIMVMSTKKVEIFDNDIIKNNVMGMGVVSYLVLQAFDTTVTITDTLYDPYPVSIYAHDNNFSRTTEYPSSNTALGIILTLQFSGGDIRDILWDGIQDPNFSGQDADKFCIKNNGSATFANLDIPDYFANMSFDASPHDCSQTPLPAAVVVAPGI